MDVPKNTLCSISAKPSIKSDLLHITCNVYTFIKVIYKYWNADCKSQGFYDRTEKYEMFR